MNNVSVKTWPEWPCAIRPNWLLVTPAASDGWPKMWRVHQSGVEGISAGQLLFLVGDVQMMKLGPWATSFVHQDQIVSVVTAPPRKLEEFLTWDNFMAIKQAEARQQAIAMAGMSGGGLVLPGGGAPRS